LTGRHVFIVSALALVLAAQAGWSVATTSGTYDETTYLGFGRALYGSLDAEGLANWGVAPLPVLLTSAAPVLAGSTGYRRAITLARISAIALFGVPLVVLTYWMLLRAGGPVAAIAGTALVILSPNVVAHASLATTDVCFMVAALAALAALAHYLEHSSRRSCALLGITLAVALAAKYSAIALFAVVALASFASPGNQPKPWVRRSVDAVALATGLFGGALLFVWLLHALALVPFGLPPFETMRLPAPIVGIARQVHRQSVGEPSFLLGTRSDAASWYYTPAALAMKSTPAELVVFGGALAALIARWRNPAQPAPPPQPQGLQQLQRLQRLQLQGLVWRIALVVLGVFGIVNRIAFGVRYVLVLIPLSTLLAAEWWFGGRGNRQRPGIAASALVVLQLFSAVAIAPHYLSYFNFFAGGPEQGYSRLADSNIDWGQDLPALKAELTRLGAKHPLLSYFGTAPTEAYGVQADRWDGRVREEFERWDWVAISATHLDGVFLWTDPFVDFRALTPGARAGYSILLYPTSREDVRRAMATAAIHMR
jgi:4-amino-4-deoxy-L-arabinose transferase-like glycosyltransferase